MKPIRTFQHQNLYWARLWRGLDQAELAQLVGVSTRTIKAYEGAAFAPALEPLRRLAKVLKFPEGFFFADAIGDNKQEAESFRAGSKMVARLRDMALGSAAVAIVFNREAERYFALPEGKLSDYSGRDPERAAELLRSRWDLGAQPVGALMPLLEEKGIRIFSLPADVEEVDTFSFWHDRTPFIFLKSGQPRDAIRAELAYELGHLVVHRSSERASKSGREEAKIFAEALVLPANAMRKLGDLSDVPQLAPAAAHFGTPPMMLARRLHRLGVLSAWKFRALRSALAQQAGSTCVPNSGHCENSNLLPRIFSSLHARGVTKHKFAHVLRVYPKDLDELTFGIASASSKEDRQIADRDETLRPKLRLVDGEGKM
jgi:Zn-dependent peptidase ImmA (M78 family)/DNA-binding XRE family transcriptional regulator